MRQRAGEREVARVGELEQLLGALELLALADSDSDTGIRAARTGHVGRASTMSSSAPAMSARRSSSSRGHPRGDLRHRAAARWARLPGGTPAGCCPSSSPSAVSAWRIWFSRGISWLRVRQQLSLLLRQVKAAQHIVVVAHLRDAQQLSRRSSGCGARCRRASAPAAG